MQTSRTRIGIIGAGPAGLMLSHLLHLAHIDNVILENRSREYAENRIRAGILEYEVAELMRETGVGARMDAEGSRHDGTNFLVDGELTHIGFFKLTGKHVMHYSQHEVVRDLIAGRLAAEGQIIFEASDVAVHDFPLISPSSPINRTARSRGWIATSSPGATVSTASAGRPFRQYDHRIRPRIPVRLARHSGRSTAVA